MTLAPDPDLARAVVELSADRDRWREKVARLRAENERLREVLSDGIGRWPRQPCSNGVGDATTECWDCRARRALEKP